MDSQDALTAAQGKQLQRKRRWVGLAVIIGIIAALIAARGFSQMRSNEGALKKGALELKAALLGDKKRFSEAERWFARASTGLVVDAYPVFCLELTRTLKEGELRVTQNDLKPAIKALLEGDFEKALRTTNKAGEGKGKTWLTRLIKAMKSP